MTMRTLITAAAILSSVGFGVSKSPSSHDSFHPFIPPIALAGVDAQLSGVFASLDQQASPLPPEPWAKGDPADSLYRLAREAMSRGDYKRAAEIFHRIPERYPQSAYAGQALYFEAYSLYQLAREALSRGDYKRAAEIFHRVLERYPQSAYAGQAMYFEAYALYRVGGAEELGTARDRLTTLKQRYPDLEEGWSSSANESVR